MSDSVDKLRADYERQGFAVAEGLLAATWCNAVLEAAQGLPSLARNKLHDEMNVHLRGGMFEQTMAHPSILRVVDRLVGGQANGLHSRFFVAPPGTTGFHPHQDGHYFEAEPACFALAWLALVDISPRNGGLFLYPGSHRAGHLDAAPVEGARDGVPVGAALPDGFERLDLAVPRGTVIFLHGHVLRGFFPNRSDARRYALSNTYLRPGSAFQVGDTERRREYRLPRPRATAAA